MSNNIREGQNAHATSKWDFQKEWHTDKSVDNAIGILERTKQDGITPDELMNLLNSAGDSGQLTEREFSQLRQYIMKNFDRLTPEAQKMFSKFDAEVQKAGGQGTAVKHHSGDERVVLQGAQLENLLKEIGALGKPPGAPPTDHVQPAPSQPAEPAPYNPPSPPAEPAPPRVGGAGGNSWGEILSAILDKLSEKEASLKERGKKLGENNKTKDEQSVSDQAELTQFQMDLQELQRLFQLVSQIGQAIHDTAKGTLGNVRV